MHGKEFLIICLRTFLYRWRITQSIGCQYNKQSSTIKLRLLEKSTGVTMEES